MTGIRFYPLALAVLMGGCVSYQPKILDPVKTQADWDGRSLKDPGLKTFLASHGVTEAKRWNQTSLVLAAFYFHPSLDMARAEVVASQAGVITAGTGPNPVLNFGPAFDGDAAAGVSPWILGYSLDLPIELGNRRKYLKAEAEQNREVARLNLASAAWAVRRGVREALSNLQSAQETAAFWKDQRPLLEKTATLMDSQVKVGEITMLEASRNRLALERANLAIREAEAAVVSARLSLAEAIGLPASALTGVKIIFQEGETSPSITVPPKEARLWAAQNRADLLAELAAYAASQAALRVEIARQYPDLSVSPGYALDQGEGKWSLGLGVTLPIFDRNQGPIATALARRDAAAAKFSAAQGRVLAEIDRALADHTSALKNLAAARGLHTRSDRQNTITQARFEAGDISQLELTLARTEAAEILKIELEARQRLAKTAGALEDAVQRPLDWPETVWSSPPRTASKP